MALEPAPAAALLRVVELRPAPGVLLLEVHGEIDLVTAPILHEAVSAAADRLVVDLGGVTFLACCGLRILLESTRRCPTVLVGTSHHPVALPLRVSGLASAFTTYPSRDAVPATCG